MDFTIMPIQILARNVAPAGLVASLLWCLQHVVLNACTWRPHAVIIISSRITLSTITWRTEFQHSPWLIEREVRLLRSTMTSKRSRGARVKVLYLPSCMCCACVVLVILFVLYWVVQVLYLSSCMYCACVVLVIQYVLYCVVQVILFVLCMCYFSSGMCCTCVVLYCTGVVLVILFVLCMLLVFLYVLCLCCTVLCRCCTCVMPVLYLCRAGVVHVILYVLYKCCACVVPCRCCRCVLVCVAPVLYLCHAGLVHLSCMCCAFAPCVILIWITCRSGRQICSYKLKNLKFMLPSICYD